MAEVKVYFSNTFDIISGNTWQEISDYAVSIPDLTATARNENFSPVISNLKILLTYETPSGSVPAVGDRVRITFGTFGYFGYIAHVDQKQEKGTIELATDNYLSRLKSKTMSSSGFKTLLESDPYGDNISKTISTITYLAFSIKTIMRCMIKIACPDMFNDPDITGVFFQRTFGGITYLGDLFEEYYQDSEMLYMLGFDSCGQLYKTEQEYQENVYNFFDFFSDVCRFTECNIFQFQNGLLKFQGNVVSFAHIESLTQVNNRHNFSVTPSTTITDSFRIATPGVIYKHNQQFNGWTGRYYLSAVEPVDESYTFPFGLPERSTDKYKDLNIPASMLFRYQYYTESSNVLNQTTSSQSYYTPLLNGNMILAFKWYSTDEYKDTESRIQKRTIEILDLPSSEKNVLSMKYSVKKDTTKVVQNTILDI